MCVGFLGSELNSSSVINGLESESVTQSDIFYNILWLIDLLFIF